MRNFRTLGIVMTCHLVTLGGIILVRFADSKQSVLPNQQTTLIMLADVHRYCVVYIVCIYLFVHYLMTTCVISYHKNYWIFWWKVRISLRRIFVVGYWESGNTVLYGAFVLRFIRKPCSWTSCMSLLPEAKRMGLGILSSTLTVIIISVVPYSESGN